MKRLTGPAICLLTLAAVICAGCATHRVDWDSRVGIFTCDQAIVELGPPDKTAKLSDGQTVAEWISRYSYGGTTSVSSGFYNGAGGVNLIQSAPAYRESKLCLTFTTNNILARWKRN